MRKPGRRDGGAHRLADRNIRPEAVGAPHIERSGHSTLNAAAGAQKVPAGGRGRSYKSAPYSKPVLKYLYAVGWIGGKKSPLSCLFARTQPGETEQEALTEIKANGKLVKQLRRVHVGQKVAASAVVKGIASACS